MPNKFINFIKVLCIPSEKYYAKLSKNNVKTLLREHFIKHLHAV